MAQVAIKLEGLAALLEKCDGDRVVKRRLRGVLRAGGNIVRNEMRRNSPRGKGRKKGRTPLYRSIQFERSRGPDEVVIRPMARHAGLVARGTRPHVMKPRRKRALAFGQFVRAQVNHPGARAQPFVERTRQQSRPQVDAKVQEMLAEITREWNSR